MGARQTKTKTIVVMPNVISARVVLPRVSNPRSYAPYLMPTSASVPALNPDHHEREPIPRTMRNFVWTEYHGENNFGVCYCCGIMIERYNAGWHCAHVVAGAKGGETRVGNLRTCCRHCNLSMGDQNLYAYIKAKDLAGPGAKHADQYMRLHTSQVGDQRNNNWGKPAKASRRSAKR